MKERIPDTTSESILSFLHFEHPTNEQTNVLIALEDFVSFKNDADFMIVSGSAGTGKSSIMNAVVKYAEAQSYRAVSYTHLDVYKRQPLMGIWTCLAASVERMIIL